MAVRIGELLLKEKRITPAQLQEALNYQKTSGGKLGLNLVTLGFVTDEEITALLSKQYGVPSINLTQFEIDASVIKLIPAETAQKYHILPLSRSGATLTIAITDPTNVFAMDDIKFMTGYNVEPVVASESAVLAAIHKYYPNGAAPRAVKAQERKPAPIPSNEANLTSAATLELVTKALEETAAIVDDDVEVLEELEQIDVASLERQGGEAPVIRLVNLMLMSAIQKGASDIHIEPYEKEFRVRFRIDGILYNAMAPPMKFRDAITSRIKIMSKLDIAEKRLPQDGRIKIRFAVDGATKEIDFRVSCLPTLFGEKIVLRLLDKDKLMLDMTKLGFESESLQKLETAIAKPWGMVLVTGPTGSGKTNTLYSSIAKINTAETNIMTAEDPVEFNLVGVNQVQVRENIGLNFAAALRSFLRQDPNIILVGEVRDFETAEIAVKAALTGHLVLSTLHTNDAPSTINRLMNMGIEPFLVASSVNLICAQRLVRRICAACKEEHPTPPQALLEAGFTQDEAQQVVPRRGRGCEKCNNTGYKGRVGLYEVMEITEELRELILVGASGLELKRKAVEEGMITLRRSGLRKVIEGVTTIEEVARETVK
ncbi:MAG TPA: type IV-A pilus assembly ATPase PilB [Vicinamibacterales bacterium]|jgi:type IV pilus assembly protein PilB|nr:type IV-A pilus assembly ATPase PilB [Vicinamibacterales bacterium]